jgi:hypothetical protein
MSCEAMLYAGPSAYETLTGEFGPPPRRGSVVPPEGDDAMSNVTARMEIAPWKSYEEMHDQLRQRFPRTYAKYASGEDAST